LPKTEIYQEIDLKVIKEWNTTRNDEIPYKFNEVHWFPNNFHSLEYYMPIDTPLINVSIHNNWCFRIRFYNKRGF